MTKKTVRRICRQDSICLAERAWSNIGTVTIYVALMLQVWCFLRGFDSILAITLWAVGLACRWAGERAGRLADAQQVLTWADEMDEKLADALDPWRLKA
ncbi:hypothetical protein [Glutamicibacter sp. NPDC087344]|uniref:hypothetical protein n=1 Tax=Glutamicibacter sp. NPDC087344 TaxID=3363994 RepID=UPI003812379E